MSWDALVTPLVGLLSAGAAAWITAKIQWRNEEVKMRFMNRKGKIERWRDITSRAKSFSEITTTEVWVYLGRNFTKDDMAFFQSHVVVVGGADGEKMKLNRIHDQINKTEALWKLI